MIIITFPDDQPSEGIQVAVASNFSETIKELSKSFEEKSGTKVNLIFGSTGKLYSQIRNGAPYDIFLAADKQRPLLLEKEEMALPHSRFTYAKGVLVLWSPNMNNVVQLLHSKSFKHITMANPKLAPYGKASKEVLQNLNLWESLQGKIAYGENIGQAFHFIQSGNAELGFIAESQFKSFKNKSSFWTVPSNLYTPIEQQAVLLNENEESSRFFEYLQSEEAKKIITEYGYIAP